MMNKDLHDNNNNDEKFLFNLHIFDSDDVDLVAKEKELAEEEKNAIPLPPSFSEEELAAAEKKGFEQGHKEAVEETQKSREQKTLDLIALISQSISPLLETEIQREKTYEIEVVSLSLAIFKKIFPIYESKHRFIELQDSIRAILSRQEGQKNIVLLVSPKDETEIKKHMENTSHSELSHIKICANESISSGACELSWEDGGAIKDVSSISNEIERLLVQALEDQGIKSDDEEESLSNTPEKVHNGSEDTDRQDAEINESLEADSQNSETIDESEKGDVQNIEAEPEFDAYTEVEAEMDTKVDVETDNNEEAANVLTEKTDD